MCEDGRLRLASDLYANIRGKRSLMFYCDTKLEWAREEYTVCCGRSERNCLAWLKTVVCKQRELRKGGVFCIERKKMLCVEIL